MNIILLFLLLNFHESINGRKQTPKALNLRNHFGYASSSSPFGEEREILPDIHVLTPEGLLSGHSSPNPATEYYSSSACDVALQPYYSVCNDITDCEVCTSSSKCGWCEATGRCLPGSVHGCACPSECSSHWLYSTLTECHQSLVAGRLSNIAPESKKLIKPQQPIKKIEETVIEPVLFTENNLFYGSHNRNPRQMTSKRLGYSIRSKITLSTGGEFIPNEIKNHGTEK